MKYEYYMLSTELLAAIKVCYVFKSCPLLDISWITPYDYVFLQWSNLTIKKGYETHQLDRLKYIAIYGFIREETLRVLILITNTRKKNDRH